MFKRRLLCGLMAVLMIWVAPLRAAPSESQQGLNALLEAEAIELPDGALRALTPELSQFMATHQPQAGDDLLKIIADAKHPLRRYAVNVFVQSWDEMSAQQINEYLRRSIELSLGNRATYPQNSGALISMSYATNGDWNGFPPDNKFLLNTHTTYSLDGQKTGQPFDYQGPMATTGWIYTDHLALGQHRVSLQLDYEFEHRGTKQNGRIRSAPFGFEIVDAAAPDTLRAPESAALDAALHEAFVVLDKEEEGELFPIINGRNPTPPRDPWAPQVTWMDAVGNQHGIHTPLWKLTKALDFDLCFEVQIEDVETGQTFPADSIVIPRGQTRDTYFSLRDTSRFVQNRSGSVPVNIMLRPSRAMALTYPEVTRYYAKPILFDNLNIEVSG